VEAAVEVHVAIAREATVVVSKVTKRVLAASTDLDSEEEARAKAVSVAGSDVAVVLRRRLRMALAMVAGATTAKLARRGKWATSKCLCSFSLGSSTVMGVHGG
jgi:hypothetical protein